MRRATKFILLLPFPVIVLIGVVVLSRLGPPPEQIRLVAQSELSRALGRPISIGRVERGTLAGAVLHDVRIGPAPHAQGEALLRTPQITVRYRLGDVLAGQTDAVGSIAQITLDRPTIAVERSAAGAWSVADLFARPKAAKPSKFAGRVVIRDGRLTLVDRHARLATTYEVKGLYADVDWGQPHWIQIAVSGESANSRFERLGAVFAYDRTKRAFQGTFEATGVTAATVGRYLPFFVPVRLASGKADVKALAFLPLRGKAAWSARLALDGVRVAAFGRSATVSGPAQLAGGVLRADGLSITMPEARLRVSGTAAGFPDTQLNLDVEARSGRPERLVPASARAALGKAVALKGPATARLRVVGPALAPSVAGRVALAGLTARGLRVEKPAADLTYREGQIWLDNFRADLAGGRVTGKAWVAPGKQGLDAVVRAEVAGVRAEQVARAMGQEPVRGGVSGDLAVSIARGKPEVVARLRVTAGWARGVAFDRARVLARWRDGRLALSEAAVDSPYGRALASGSASRSALDLNVALTRVDLSKAGALLYRSDLGGIVSAQGRLTGPLASPRFEGAVVASDLSVAGYQVDALQAPRVSATRREIQLTTATLYRAGGRITVTGKLVGPNFADAQVSGTAQVRSADLAELYAPKGRTPPLAGLLNASLDIGGRLSGPRASGTVDVAGLEFEGTGLGALHVEGDYRDGRIGVTEGRITLNGSRVGIEGAVAVRPAPGAMDLTVHVTNLDLSRLLVERLRALKVRLGGHLNLQAHVTGPLMRPSASATVTDSQVIVNGVHLRNVAAGGSWSANRAQLDTVRFDLGKGAYTAHGAVDTRDGSLDLTFGAGHADLDSLRAGAQALSALPGAWGRRVRLVAKAPPLSGAVTASGKIAGTAGARTGEVTFSAQNLALGGNALPDVGGTVRFAGPQLTLADFTAEAEQALATAKGTIDLDGQMHLDVNANNISADTIQSFTHIKQPLSGTADVSIQVTGPTRSPHVVVTANASDARIGLLHLGDVLVSRVEIADGTLTVDRVTLAPGGRQVWASGKAAFSWTAPHRPPDGPLDISINLGKQDLGLLAAVLPEIVTRARGPVSGTVHVGGTWAHPRYEGQVEAHAENEGIAIGKFATTGLDASLRLATEEGAAPRPTISGRVAVRSVFGLPPLDFARALKQRHLPAVLDPRLNLQVVIEDGTRLETAAVGMWLSGKGRIGGTLAAPTLSVSMESRRGFLQFPGARFRLTYASVDFSRAAPTPEQPSPRMRLALNADYEGEATRYLASGLGQTYSITMHLSGDLLDPNRPLEAALRSVPDLPERDVYAMVMGVGGFLSALREGTATALLGTQARDLFTAGYVPSRLQPLEQQIAQGIGVEEFGLELGALTTGQPVRIRIGKALSNRLYVTYSRAVARGQTDQLRLQFELAPTLSLGWTYESVPLQPATALPAQHPATRIELRKAWRF